jgi:hypothetical protein
LLIIAGEYNEMEDLNRNEPLEYEDSLRVLKEREIRDEVGKGY